MSTTITPEERAELRRVHSITSYPQDFQAKYSELVKHTASPDVLRLLDALGEAEALAARYDSDTLYWRGKYEATEARAVKAEVERDVLAEYLCSFGSPCEFDDCPCSSDECDKHEGIVAGECWIKWAAQEAAKACISKTAGSETQGGASMTLDQRLGCAAIVLQEGKRRGILK